MTEESCLEPLPLENPVAGGLLYFSFTSTERNPWNNDLILPDIDTGAGGLASFLADLSSLIFTEDRYVLIL